MLERNNSAFISILENNSLRLSHDLWHAWLGHVNYSIIYRKNKNKNKRGYLSLTSLPSPSLCSTCQLAKSH